ncbi:hypothetical protein C1H57_25085, partial [Clostridium sp. 2-1]
AVPRAGQHRIQRRGAGALWRKGAGKPRRCGICPEKDVRGQAGDCARRHDENSALLFPFCTGKAAAAHHLPHSEAEGTELRETAFCAAQA